MASAEKGLCFESKGRSFDFERSGLSTIIKCKIIILTNKYLLFMKKIYLSPESNIIPIKVKDILTSSSEGMHTVNGSWDDPELAPSNMFERFNSYYEF